MTNATNKTAKNTSVSLGGKKYTATTVKGINARIGGNKAKLSQDITELLTVCIKQAGNGNLTYFNDYLMVNFLHSVTGKPTVDGKAVLAYAKLVYPAVAYDEAAKGFSFVEGVNREKFATGQTVEKKGKQVKVKENVADLETLLPLTFGDFKDTLAAPEKAENKPQPLAPASVNKRLEKLGKTFSEQGIKASEKSDIAAMKAAADEMYKQALAAIAKAEDALESPEMVAADMAQATQPSSEKRADLNRAAHAESEQGQLTMPVMATRAKSKVANA